MLHVTFNDKYKNPAPTAAVMFSKTKRVRNVKIKILGNINQAHLLAEVDRNGKSPTVKIRGC